MARGCLICARLSWGEFADAETLFAHVKEQDFGCYRLSFRRDGGGHLVVIQKEARVHASGAFLSWFRTFLDESSYRKRYTKAMVVELVTKS